MTKTKTIWRLANKPTAEEVTDLFKAELLTKEEAREILISLETEEERTKKSLQEEIRFLRDLVQKLSNNPKVIVETIREIEKPYYKRDWYQPYYYYANNQAQGSATTTGTSILTLSAPNSVVPLSTDSFLTNAQTQDFNQIKTF